MLRRGDSATPPRRGCAHPPPAEIDRHLPPLMPSWAVSLSHLGAQYTHISTPPRPRLPRVGGVVEVKSNSWAPMWLQGRRGQCQVRAHRVGPAPSSVPAVPAWHGGQGSPLCARQRAWLQGRRCQCQVRAQALSHRMGPAPSPVPTVLRRRGTAGVRACWACAGASCEPLVSRRRPPYWGRLARPASPWARPPPCRRFPLWERLT